MKFFRYVRSGKMYGPKFLLQVLVVPMGLIKYMGQSSFYRYWLYQWIVKIDCIR